MVSTNAGEEAVTMILSLLARRPRRALVITAALVLLVTPIDAQAPSSSSGTAPAKPAPPVKRLPDGKPDIQGVFQADHGGANYGLERRTGDALTPATRGVLVDPADGKLPMRDWAREEVARRARPERGYDDPTAHCLVAGVPRSMYVPSPMHILQPPGYVVILHERMSWRIIPIGGTHTLPDHVRLWQGDSIGRWEGDTLVIESKNFNGKAWLNEVGEMVSHAQTVVERLRPIDGDTIEYRATVTDPVVYTRPWTISFRLNRQEGELLEVACLEDDQDLKHLKDVKDEFEKNKK
jgi:hypothetical protein